MQLRNLKERYLIKEIRNVPDSETVIGYARVSTLDQAVNSNALEQQIKRLEDAGATLIIADAQTGKRDDRPGLQETMKRVQELRATEVIVTRLDRLGRRVPIIRNNVQLFQETNINLKVLDQNIDLRSSYGMFTVNLLASLAEMEVDQISERVKHGKAHRRKQQLACDSLPFGYTTSENHYRLDHTPFLCVLTERPSNYQELSELGDLTQLPGITVAQLARSFVEIFLKTKGATPAVRAMNTQFGIGHSPTKKNGNDKKPNLTPVGFKKWLGNPVLRGHTAYNKRIKSPNGRRKEVAPENWTIIHDTHPEDRIISDEEFAKIEEIFSFNATRYSCNLYNYDPNNSNSYTEYAYLRGLVYCAECGSKCYSKTRLSKDNKTKYHYFACRYARQGCTNFRGTRKELIEKALVNSFLQQSVVLNSTTPSPSDVLPVPIKSPKIQQLENRLKHLEAISDFDPDLELLKNKTRQQIKEELNPFAHNALDTKTAEEIIQAGNNLLIWYTLSTDEKVDIYRKIVQRVTVYNGEINSVFLQTSQGHASALQAPD
jgi:DNA invertase Pin-like site-specific DNA recombinase